MDTYSIYTDTCNDRVEASFTPSIHLFSLARLDTTNASTYTTINIVITPPLPLSVPHQVIGDVLLEAHQPVISTDIHTHTHPPTYYYY